MSSTAYALLRNPNKHYYTTRNKPIKLIVLHVTAGLEKLGVSGPDHSARGTNNYGATTKTPASWHVCTDSDSIDPALPDSYTAFHCRGYNSGSLGLEISNRTATWRDKPKWWVEATLRQAAIVCHRWETKYNIPRKLLTKAQVDAGHKGYSFHSRLDPARRRDPGADFPWAQFVGYLEELDRPKPAPKPEPKPVPVLPPLEDIKKRRRNMIVGVNGGGKYRLVTGDRIIGISKEFHDNLVKSGHESVQIPTHDLDVMHRFLVAENCND